MLRRRRVTAFGFAVTTIAAAFAAAAALAQGPGGGDSVAVTAAAKPATVAHGGKGEVLVTLTMKPGWHVYAADPGSSDFIPTTVTAKGGAGVTVGKAKFPKAKAMKTSAAPKPVNVYEGKAVIAVPFTVAANAKPGKQTLTANVGYQTCNDTMCLPPANATVTVAVTVK